MGYDRLFSGDVAYTEQLGVLGRSKHPLYSTWRMMNVRCYDDRHKAYHRYGGRGVAVCEDWRWDNPFGFFNFLDWCGGSKAVDTTLDRIDNDKSYCPDNCKWSTKKEQQNNIGIGKRNTTGVLGISPRNNGFVAQICLNGEASSLGTFATKEEAEAAYNTAKAVKIESGDAAVVLLIEQEFFKKKSITGRALWKRKTSKYFGVCWSEEHQYWRAYYSHVVDGKRKQKHLGCFDDEDAAALAVDAYVKEILRGQE